MWGERSGEEGAGEEEETPVSACDADARLGIIPYLGRGAVSVCLWP